MYSTAVACEGDTNLNWNLLLFYLIKLGTSAEVVVVCACCMLTLSLVSTTVDVLERESLKRVRVTETALPCDRPTERRL